VKRLYEARDRFEAQWLKDFLADYHIESVILGDYLSGAAGDLPANVFPAVWVVEDLDLPRARELLQEFQEQLAAPPEGWSWRCPACGEVVEAQFQFCWNCGTARKKE